MVEWVIIIAFGIAEVIAVIGLIAMLRKLWKSHTRLQELEEKVEHPLVQATYTDITPLQRAIDSLPNRILQSFQGSINTQKGTLGELIGYVKLQAQYDRLIPMNSITDFLGIRFPKDGDPGIITFIDIKTGKSARLSNDQRMFKKLIEDKRIEFAKITITADSPDEDKSS